MKIHCYWLTLLLIMLIGCEPRKTPVPKNAMVIKNGTVIDGTGKAPISDGIVVVQEDRIKAVGAALDFSVSSDSRVIDAEGGTILPGIINSHTHYTGDPKVRRDFLVEGVTSVCNVGTPLDTLSKLKQTTTSEGPAARGLFGGPIITAPGGYPGPVYGFDINYEVSTPKEARNAVLDLINRGAASIKMALEPGRPQKKWPIPEMEEVRAIVEEAHAHGLLVRVHVFDPSIVENIVLPAGCNVIEHLPFPILSEDEVRNVLKSNDPLTQLFDIVAPEYNSLLSRIVGYEIALVPTLDVLIGRLYGASDLTNEQKFKIDAHLEAVRRFHALGGRVALGNDYGVTGVELGMPMKEFKLLLAAGLTLMEVIEAGTRHAAYVCGQEKKLGTLEQGKFADVIIVDGNPLIDIEAMSKVVVVIKGGEVAYTSK